MAEIAQIKFGEHNRCWLLNHQRVITETEQFNQIPDKTRSNRKKKPERHRSTNQASRKMISERHKSRDLVTILGLFHLLLLGFAYGDHVVEVLAQSTTASTSQPQTLETIGSQDGAALTPGATTGERTTSNVQQPQRNEKYERFAL